MIEFIIGVCIGYFCRPIVAVVVNFIANAWQKYQQSKTNDTNNPQ